MVLEIKDQTITNFVLDNQQSDIKIVNFYKNEAEGVVAEQHNVLLMQIKKLSVLLESHFKVYSRPDWIRDEGSCATHFKDLDLNLYLLPTMREGRIVMELDQFELNIDDFDSSFNGTTDISKAIGMIFNEGKQIFISNLRETLQKELRASFS